MPLLSGVSESRPRTSIGSLPPSPLDFPLSPCASHADSSPAKGLYYRLLAPRRRADLLVNVGGLRYAFAWTDLERFPLTRLGRLRACSNREDILALCDDYDVSLNEFFFDRNPGAFRAIMTFLRAGKLRILGGVCVLSFREELSYWGVEENNLELCCLSRILQKDGEMQQQQQYDDQDGIGGDADEAAAAAAAGAEMNGDGVRDVGDDDVFGADDAEGMKLGRPTRCVRAMGHLRDMVENPSSGPAGKAFACISVAFVTITAVSLCVGTMPELREEKGECSQKCRDIFVVESVCVAWFSLEFALRFVQARSKCRFMRTPLNVIDMIAILPYYVTLLVDSLSDPKDKAAGGSSYLEKVGLVLRVLRALRILYVMRLARHSLGLQSLGLTVRRCTREFGLLVLFLCVAMALFAPLEHLVESEMGNRESFSSVPATYWWAIISMTTVGYGDVVPHSVPGQVVALSSILSGILLMAFPVTSIFHTFSRSYVELKEQQQQATRRGGRRFHVKARGSDSS
uniref:Potassium voltage-gated channel subfamily G member 2 n=1 Tax=Petromyzon marinus TaxID=7757 RepID=A0AAJ7TFU3_PETMA|nr:potassium voltage-gated channel subfamily G member 2 [Petromyzon marinus]